MTDGWKNKLYFGDNLTILRDYVPDESVDLIYLDPPFNSKATYNVLFAEQNGTKSQAQIKAFDDTWHWGMESEEAFHELVAKGPGKLPDLMDALRRFLGTNDMMAYLTMMAIRLVELRRVLKPTGSIYLHCDPTASHYLKLVMDAVFGQRNFGNEIVWCYTGPSNTKTYFPRKHDIIFFYAKDVDRSCFFPDAVRVPYAKSLEAARARTGIFAKKDYSDLNARIKKYDAQGKVIEDWWADITPVGRIRTEVLGYPTQKPEALLERIVQASSNEGDLVLDPFCGCGTTIAVAERLKRRWIGIDITHLAITLMRTRLRDTFGPDLSPYEVIGAPTDLAGAEALAQEDRDQFQLWALGLVEARPSQETKGADQGVDGVIRFFDDLSGKAKKIIVQVKSGGVKRNDIATLKGDMEREGAAIGAFLTLEEPTEPMRREAASAGFYEAEAIGKKYPKIQILTIAELLAGKELQYPRLDIATFRKAPRKAKRTHEEREIEWGGGKEPEPASES